MVKLTRQPMVDGNDFTLFSLKLNFCNRFKKKERRRKEIRISSREKRARDLDAYGKIFYVGMNLAYTIEAQVERGQRGERVDELGYFGELVVANVEEFELVEVDKTFGQSGQRVLVEREQLQVDQEAYLVGQRLQSIRVQVELLQMSQLKRKNLLLYISKNRV